MGGVMQRLEVLLIGLVLLLAGAVAGILVFVRPPGPVYLQTAPQPVVTRVALSGGDPNGASLAAPTPTAATQSPAPSVTAPLAEAVPSGAPAVSPVAAIVLRSQAIWPWIVLLAGLSAVPLLLVRFHGRRMTYTNQNVEQLLAASDPVTRASNLRVLRSLSEQGVLTRELAAAAGIDLNLPRRQLLARLLQLRLPRPRLPGIELPALHLPTVRFPRYWFGLKQWRHARRSNRLPSAAAKAADAADERINVNRAMPDHTASSTDSQHALVTPAAARAVMSRADGEGASDAWSAAERAQAAVAVIAQIWRDLNLHSVVTAVDATRAPGSGPVFVTIDPHPEDDGRLDDLPARLIQERPTWRAAWRRGLLTVFVHTEGTMAPVGGPLLLPALMHGRGGKLTRFLPLASCRHLGLYGAGALRALQGLLGELLFAQPPSNLALMIIDQGELTPLYRDVAHLVPVTLDGEAALKLLAGMLQRQTSTQEALTQVRPLVLVVVEPDDGRLQALSTLITRLRAAPKAPLHVLVVQERLRRAGRELYALLPAIITSAGQGSADLLPGSAAWPKPGAARLVGPKMRLDGRPLCINESALAAMITQLRGKLTCLPPTIWDRSAASEPARIVLGPPAREVIKHPSQEEQPPAWVADNQALSDTPATHAFPPEMPDIEEGQTGTRPQRVVEPHHTVPPVPLASAADDGEQLSRSSSQANDTTTTDVDQERTEQPSRQAALLRAASAAGRADAPPVAFRPGRGGPGTDEQATRRDAQAPQASAHRPAPVTPIAEPENGWPAGPPPLGRAALAELMARIVSTPMIIAGQANEVGVTKNRLVDLLKGTDKAQAKELTETLLAWFDLAGLLAEPSKPGRLRHPRPLTTTSLIEIAERLNATPCPDQSTVQMLWARSNEGRD